MAIQSIIQSIQNSASIIDKFSRLDWIGIPGTKWIQRSSAYNEVPFYLRYVVSHRFTAGYKEIRL